MRGDRKGEEIVAKQFFRIMVGILSSPVDFFAVFAPLNGIYNRYGFDKLD